MKMGEPSSSTIIEMPWLTLLARMELVTKVGSVRCSRRGGVDCLDEGERRP